MKLLIPTRGNIHVNKTRYFLSDRSTEFILTKYLWVM